MKKYYPYALLSIITSITTSTVFADNILGVGNDTKLKNGDISFSDIPKMISYATSFLLGFAATIAMIMIIYGAFQMTLIAITSEEKKKGYDTMQHGIIGFVIAVSAWLIIKVVISNL